MKLRPRFSVRTLAVVMTTVCVYFGTWEATKRYGLKGGQEANSPFPLIVVQTDLREERVTRLADPGTNFWMERRAYLWLFGPKIGLPFGWVTAYQTVDAEVDPERS